MLITPNPGVAYGQVRNVLLSLASEAGNLHSTGQAIGPGASASKLWAYLGWVRRAEATLSRLIFRADARELLDWAGYENLMMMAPAWAASVGGNPQERILAELLTEEITKRVDVIEAARAAVEDQMATWGGGFSQTLVFDTSVYLSYILPLTKIDWGKFMVKGDQGIRLAVPMIVIDELDATKADSLRGRASLALAVLDKALREDGKLARDPVPVEVMLFNDPLGHTRLPINDQEIVARTLALQAIAQSPVTLLTCDTGMALRAREAGLAERKLERQDSSKGNKRKTSTVQPNPSGSPTQSEKPRE
ncbi:PIN domain-containing protein [Actinophytocola sp. KF-1]